MSSFERIQSSKSPFTLTFISFEMILIPFSTVFSVSKTSAERLRSRMAVELQNMAEVFRPQTRMCTIKLCSR
ncbi:hypothetical protein BDR06DRAFT_949105 [Suillus hirtellus]|nr:hypothetical protein BDR06DRAFT_949105 [Suillus hirtellus]